MAAEADAAAAAPGGTTWIAAQNEAALERFAGPLTLEQPDGDDFYAYYLAHAKALGVVPHPQLLAGQALHARNVERATEAAAARAAAEEAGDDEQHSPPPAAPEAKSGPGGGKAGAAAAAQQQQLTAAQLKKQKEKEKAEREREERERDLVRVVAISNTVLDSGTLAAVCLALPLCKSVHTLRLVKCALTHTHIRELAQVLPKTGVTTLAIDHNPLPPLLPPGTAASALSSAAPGAGDSTARAAGAAAAGSTPFSSTAVASALGRLLHSRGAPARPPLGSTGKSADGKEKKAAAAAASAEMKAPSGDSKPGSAGGVGVGGVGGAAPPAGDAPTAGAAAAPAAAGGSRGGAVPQRQGTAPGTAGSALGVDAAVPEVDEVFAELLDGNTTLQSLSLRGNDIGFYGLQALCNALRKNHTLLSLNLAFNRFGDVLGTGADDDYTWQMPNGPAVASSSSSSAPAAAGAAPGHGHATRPGTTTGSVVAGGAFAGSGMSAAFGSGAFERPGTAGFAPIGGGRPLPTSIPSILQAPYLSTLVWGVLPPPPEPVPVPAAASKGAAAGAAGGKAGAAGSSSAAAGSGARKAGAPTPAAAGLEHKRGSGGSGAVAAAAASGAHKKGESVADPGGASGGHSKHSSVVSLSKPVSSASAEKSPRTGTAGKDGGKPDGAAAAGTAPGTPATTQKDAAAAAAAAPTGPVMPALNMSAVACTALLAEMLLGNKSLVALNLSDNRLNDDAVKLLSTVFWPVALDKDEVKRLKKDGLAGYVNSTKAVPQRDVNHALRALDLSANRLTDASAPALLRMAGDSDEHIAAFTASVTAALAAQQQHRQQQEAGATARSSATARDPSPERALTAALVAAATTAADSKHAKSASKADVKLGKGSAAGGSAAKPGTPGDAVADAAAGAGGVRRPGALNLPPGKSKIGAASPNAAGSPSPMAAGEGGGRGGGKKERSDRKALLSSVSVRHCHRMTAVMRQKLAAHTLAHDSVKLLA